MNQHLFGTWLDRTLPALASLAAQGKAFARWGFHKDVSVAWLRPTPRMSFELAEKNRPTLRPFSPGLFVRHLAQCSSIELVTRLHSDGDEDAMHLLNMGYGVGICARYENDSRLWRLIVVEPVRGKKAIGPRLAFSRSPMMLTAHSPQLSVARTELQDAIRSAIDFVPRVGATELWQPRLELAGELLSSSSPEVPPPFPAILPDEGYSLSARQVVATAVAADFWANIPLYIEVRARDKQDEEAFTALRGRLHRACHSAIVSAVNDGLEA